MKQKNASLFQFLRALALLCIVFTISVSTGCGGGGRATSTGHEGDLQKGIAWPSQRFTVDVTGNCVTDNLTGLMWVQAPDSTRRTWQVALDYANNLNLCGYSDWRLPNKNEMRSLINYKEGNPARWLNTQGFSNVQADYYWTSTTYARNNSASGDTSFAWVVDMGDGHVSSDHKVVTIYTWPVRAGQ